LRLAALAAVIAGVVLLAAAAFVLSYEGIHQIALQAGVSPGLAKLYPLIFDAMLVIAAAAALALRGAGWWARCYAWGSLLILLAAVAVGDALHATGTTLPAQPTKAAVAVTPWVLLLMAFGLLLEMLRHFRTTRSAAAKATLAGVPASAGPGADVNGGPQTAAGHGASGSKVRDLPRVDLDTLLGPRAGEPPPVEVPRGTGAGENAGHQADPVSYGEETGYVHPDSYLDEGEYSPHGDTGGPGSPAGPAGDPAAGGADLATAGATAAETAATSTETQATAPGPSATSTETQATAPGPSATAAEAPGTAAEAPGTAAEAPGTAAEAPGTTAEAPGTTAEAPGTTAEAPGTTAEEARATSTAPPAGVAAPGAENGQAAGGDRAAAEAPTGTAEAGQGGDGSAQKAAGAEGPALERIRSTPTRPEE
jgi:hypothetical protein